MRLPEEQNYRWFLETDGAVLPAENSTFFPEDAEALHNEVCFICLAPQPEPLS
jgi:hypothetical protein